ncbi:MAG: primosomal protein N' [Candidatus Melainabacteria bacterium]|nr:primosomal protein N' [Candidatus Melainabacteria bacterium]
MKSDTCLELKESSNEPQVTHYAKVAIDLPVPLSSTEHDYFYYFIPEELKEEIKVGTVVHVPFGKQESTGYVLETVNTLNSKNDFKIRPIYSVIYNSPIWDDNYLKLARWISNYYLTNIGTVLSSSASSDFFDQYTHEVELSEEIHDSTIFTSEQKFIIDKLLKSTKKSLSYKFLLQKSRFTKQRFYQLINELKNKGVLRAKIKYIEKKETKTQNGKNKELNLQFPAFSPKPSTLTLNKEQENAYNLILESIQKKEAKTFLLHGITGSGKTEVYLKLFEDVLKKDKTAIYLVPEIYLIPQAFERLAKRFNSDEIVIWHSSVSKKERFNSWEKIQSNDKKVKIILGARSAILAPIKNIGLIVLDEAHDPSYKQASPAPRYDAIKVALKRGEIENCPVILGTATPNIVDYHNCLKNHTILELPNRIENVPMPKVYLVDLTNEYPQTNKNIISNVLKSSINEALSKNEQIILLLNRRGYSSHIFCRACGFIQFCKNCSVPLVFHKNYSLMICHHCGYQANTIRECPDCKSPHFKYSGLGTQQLEEEVIKIFSNAKVIRVDSDQLRKKDEYIKIWKDFSSHKADILIGTQLVAKGLDLPNVTVVGVVLADTMLHFPDYVSHERAFQILTQVTGRAGRGQKEGKVFIQTYQPDNPVFKFIQDHNFNSFYKNEIKQRELFSYPPFTKLSRIIFQSLNEKECLDFANEILKHLLEISSGLLNLTSSTEGGPTSGGQSFLGPAPCFFTKLHNKYRYHILCKIPNEEKTNFIFNRLFQRINKNAKVDIVLDIDSVNLL